MLLELLRDAENRSLVFNPANLAFALNEPDIDLVRRVCTEYGLFDLDEQNHLSSPWLEAQMAAYDEAKEAARAAGRRGAAKRYGKAVPDESEKATPPIAPPYPPLQVPHGNIINSTNKTESTNSRSRLLGLTWGDMTGEDLFNLARNGRTVIGDTDREWIKLQQEQLDRKCGPNTHNMGCVLDIAEHFGLGQEVLMWLFKYTNYGQIGRPPIMKLVKIYNEARETRFKPKYAAEYVICKLLEP